MSEKSPDSVKTYAVNAASSVATKVLQLTVLVWVNHHLLKRIAPEEYSLFPIVMSLVFFGDIFRNIFTGGLGRYLVEADARGDDEGVSTIVSSMIPVLGGVALILAMIGCVAVWKLDHLIKVPSAYLADARIMLLLLLIPMCLSIITAPYSQGLYVKQRFVLLNLTELGMEVLRIGILLALLFLVSTKVLWLVVASTCSAIVGLGIRIILTRKYVPAIRFRLGQFSLQTARTLMSFGAWTSIQGITELMKNTAPTLLLNRFGSAVDVAAFHLGRLPDTQLRRVIAAASIPAQPALTAIYATKGDQALNDLYYRGGRYYLWITLLLIPPLLVFGKEMVVLYAGHQYLPTAGVIFAFLAIYPFLWASAMFYRVAHAIAKVRAYYICDIVVQGLGFLALYYAVAIKDFGALGAATALAITNGALHLVLIWPMGLKLVNGRLSTFVRNTLIPGLLPCLAALLVCTGLQSKTQINTWTSLGVATTLSGLTYFCVLLTFCLDPVDRTFFNRVKKRFTCLVSWRFTPTKSQIT